MSQTKAQLLGPVLGDVNFDNNTLFVDNVNNRVGFGVSNPIQKVHIDGSALISNNNYYYGYSSVGNQTSLIGITSSNNIIIGQNNANHSNTYIYGGTGNIYLSTGGNNNLTVTSGGDVNIGDPYVTASTNDAVGSKSLYFPGAGWNTGSGSVAVGTQLISTHGYWSGNYSNSFGQTYPDFRIRIKNSDSADYVEKFAFQGNGVLRLSEAGGGILFSAFSSSGNLLDDYEEGDYRNNSYIRLYDPNDTTSSFPILNTSAWNSQGYYTKTGGNVLVNHRIQSPLNSNISDLNSTTYDSYLIRITLPFTVGGLGRDTTSFARNTACGVFFCSQMSSQPFFMAQQYGEDYATIIGIGTWGQMRALMTSAPNYQWWFSINYTAS